MGVELGHAAEASRAQAPADATNLRARFAYVNAGTGVGEDLGEAGNSAGGHEGHQLGRGALDGCTLTAS